MNEDVDRMRVVMGARLPRKHCQLHFHRPLIRMGWGERG